MNCLEAIRKRSSCRDFSDKKVEAQKVEKILEAGLASPTAVNARLLRFASITDTDLIDRISALVYTQLDESYLAKMKERRAKNLFYGAPLLIVISSTPYSWSGVDAGIAAQSICLVAEELGLSSCINGMSRFAFSDDSPSHMRSELGMEEDERYLISIAIGYAQSRKEPHEFSWDHIRSF